MTGVRAVDVAGPDAARAAAVLRAVAPEEVLGPADFRHDAALDPRHALLLATAAGVDAAVAELCRIESWDEPHGLWLRVWVLPGHHGTAWPALWAAVLGHSARHAVTLLRTGVPVDQDTTLTLLTAEGFREVERSQRVRLPLTERPAPPVPPPGVALVRLADDPALLDDLVALDAETVPDIPGDGGDAPDRAWWEERLAARDFDPRTVVAAVSAGRAVAYTALRHHHGRSDVASVEYTATARAFRGRGLSVLVKRACHTAAWDAGIREIRAWNHLDNAPMRAVNDRLGFMRMTDVALMKREAPGGSGDPSVRPVGGVGDAP